MRMKRVKLLRGILREDLSLIDVQRSTRTKVQSHIYFASEAELVARRALHYNRYICSFVASDDKELIVHQAESKLHRVGGRKA